MALQLIRPATWACGETVGRISVAPSANSLMYWRLTVAVFYTGLRGQYSLLNDALSGEAGVVQIIRLFGAPFL